MQIDDPARGFTFKAEGPLDMRMNPHRGEPATAFLSNVVAGGLARVLAENADEPRAIEVAAAILAPPTRGRPLGRPGPWRRPSARPGGPTTP